MRTKTQPNELTWDKAGQRWKRKYRGRVFYAPRGVRKSDRQQHAVALALWNDWRKEIDAQPDTNKPNAAQYADAMLKRQAMLDWLLKERENQQEYNAWCKPVGCPTWQDEHDRLVKELERLYLDFSRVNPPALDKPGTLTVDPLAYRTDTEKMNWIERIEALEAHNRWIGATDPCKTLSPI